MNILIVKLSAIGDVVHTLPAAAWIRRALPGARISWAVERKAGAILEGSPVIDRLIELDSSRWRKQPFNRATIDEIKEQTKNLRGSEKDEPVDVAIDFQGLLKSGVVAKASGAQKRIGFESADLRERASRLFLTDQIKTARITHVIEKNLALARAALIVSGLLPRDDAADMKPDPASYEFPIEVSGRDKQYIDETVSDAGKFAILNPGGGWPTKLWPAERFGQVADELLARYGIRSFITYGPGEEVLAERVASSSRTRAARTIASTLKQFVALARRAELFVGGDTGPLHLAAACGTPIVGLYGPTSPERNGPFDPRDLTIARDLWCRADCHRRSCWHWGCMDIPVSEVQEAISKRIGREARAR
ncbi:MAG TPA: glycosyltransferase family 9 protein [Blastocatellia bacterium]|nr:glycosyltransferase family 9 protein [Blastocatellia bacterium]